MAEDRSIEQVELGDMQAHAGEFPVQTIERKPGGKVERKLYPPAVDAALGVNAQLLSEGG